MNSRVSALLPFSRLLSFFFPSLFSLLLTRMHSHTSSHFHLQKAVCTLNTPMHSTLLGHRGRRKRHYCQIFRFRVFILYVLVKKDERQQTLQRLLTHIYPVSATLSGRDSSSSPFLPSVSSRKCFYNRSYLALFFDFIHPPDTHTLPPRLSLPLQVCIVTL